MGWCRRNNNVQIFECGHYKIQYVTKGIGQPTVVFESGLGDGLDGWSTVQNRISAVTSTFAYNRPGYGKSRCKNDDRHGLVIADELYGLLKKLGYKSPYLLVGHSLGGAYMEIFAKRYQDDTAGLLLVDPMAAEMDELCKSEDIKEWELSSLRKAVMSVFMPRGTKKELKRREITLLQTKTKGYLIDQFPVVIISAIKSMWSPVLQAAWLKSHQLQSERYSHCKQVIAKSSGHNIQQDDPELVVGEILAALELASGR